jgi:hypothetical protein
LEYLQVGTAGDEANVDTGAGELPAEEAADPAPVPYTASLMITSGRPLPA